MLIWFECKEKNLMISLETDIKPTVRDTVRVNDRDYSVEKVIWCLENLPAQPGLIIEISPKNQG